jgi:hypothetical protein
MAVKDFTLAGYAGRMWSQISMRKYMFDVKEQGLELLKVLTKEEVVTKFEKLFYSEARICEV